MLNPYQSPLTPAKGRSQFLARVALYGFALFGLALLAASTWLRIRSGEPSLLEMFLERF